jgi:peptidoglycan hydrolase-like protein with peptidoglycan-binding domain
LRKGVGDGTSIEPFSRGFEAGGGGATRRRAYLPGGRGDHVAKIQQALIELDGAKIGRDGIYGPATAGAVLAYKRKRNIINTAYQTQADESSLSGFPANGFRRSSRSHR